MGERSEGLSFFSKFWPAPLAYILVLAAAVLVLVFVLVPKEAILGSGGQTASGVVRRAETEYEDFPRESPAAFRLRVVVYFRTIG